MSVPLLHLPFVGYIFYYKNIRLKTKRVFIQKRLLLLECPSYLSDYLQDILERQEQDPEHLEAFLFSMPIWSQSVSLSRTSNT